ncbi:NADH dehydrogenase [Staphylococcus sp. HMSC036D05]|uniref:NADH dehydrogenase subunit 5 n=1 Tax=Staphylococcus sp. HMSC036D05 TaxID=1715059 RepID=UPI0008A82FAE|nr:NADH dehydrogenase subunit 5 [Staphylococcus sp. HMSC036D05]OHO72499.1 NADH dehydrogenase [Staphylococcus sp. HMSC036D05]
MLSMSIVLTIFFITLVIAILSGLLFLNQSVPIKYINIHLYLVFLPIIIGIIGLLTVKDREQIGPFTLDHLAWLMGSFILVLGFIIQKFSARYLIGDRNYRKYFPLFTLITSFASVAWLSGDLRLMVLFWGATLLSLTLLIRVNRSWKIPYEAAKVSGKSFALGWFALLVAVVLLFVSTGDWHINIASSYDNTINSGMKFFIDILIVIAVIVPAAQFPFQSWLIESVAAPTPVSAIMHAGIVNAGGIILTRFSPVFDNSFAITILLIIASVSVLLGSGISLVHVDYKRQLVGSTMSQMGFMLVQCALGVYSAAIIHLILHGVFKATLFLQSGSVVKRFNIPTPPSAKRSYSWVVLGRLLAIVIAVAFWLNSDRSPYEIISALILAWSLMVSWNQMVAFSRGLIGRVVGVMMIVIVAIVYIITHHYFYNTLNTVYMHIAHPPVISIIISIIILVLGSILSIWVARQRDSKAFAILYLWLVKLGEAKAQSIESHPTYLKKYL